MTRAGRAVQPLLMMRCLLVGLVVVVMGAGCNSGWQRDRPVLTILADADHAPVQPMINAFAEREHIDVRVTYTDSADLVRSLRQPTVEYDAVWAGSTYALTLGDVRGRVEDATSVMRSPVVLGVEPDTVAGLPVSGGEIGVDQIQAAVADGQMHLAMPSATQSTTGMLAYLSMLHGISGQTGAITLADLERDHVRDSMAALLGRTDAAGDTPEAIVAYLSAHADNSSAIFGQEATIIGANRLLIAAGQEPLQVVYLADTPAVADAPLGFVDRGDAERLALFDRLRAHLVSEDGQRDVTALGWRTGPPELIADMGDPVIFDSAWGVDLEQGFTTLPLPDAGVLNQAMVAYQTELRRPSFTILCVDFSGSLADAGEDEVQAALGVLLRQDLAAEYGLQATPDDITVVIPFNDAVGQPMVVRGNNPDDFARLDDDLGRIISARGTNLYQPVIEAVRFMDREGIGERQPAIVLLTDGESNVGEFTDLEGAWAETPVTEGTVIPVHAVMFGDASERQLRDITTFTGGVLSDGRDDLLAALRAARGIG